jgi:uncharacterized protein RhaS with RHS repeats
MGFRYYDPASGRFLTKDPIGPVRGINAYAYVTNNPVNLIDPIGLWGMQFGDNGPNIGFGSPWWISTRQNVGEGLSEGWGATADVMNPFGNPWSDMGYYNPCAKWVGTTQKLTRAGLYSLGGAGASRIIAALPANSALWSGGDIAKNAAEASGLRTLEGTSLGQMTQRFTMWMGTKGAEWPLQRLAWKASSAAFVLTSRGPLHAYLNDLSAESVYLTVERPLALWLGRAIIPH